MAEEIKAGCARPTGGVVGESVEEKKATAQKEEKREVKSMVMIGRKVPDFMAPGYF